MPLNLAFKNEHKPFCELLIRRGADRSILVENDDNLSLIVQIDYGVDTLEEDEGPFFLGKEELASSIVTSTKVVARIKNFLLTYHYYISPDDLLDMYLQKYDSIF